MEAVHARLEAHAGAASMADLLCCRSASRNCTHQQRCEAESALPSAGLALVRCDGAGSSVTAMSSARCAGPALRDQEGIGVMFVLHGTEDAASAIRRGGFEVTNIDDNRDLHALCRGAGPACCCWTAAKLNRAELENMRAGISVIAIIDDGADARLACDFAYYPPVRRPTNWPGRARKPRSVSAGSGRCLASIRISRPRTLPKDRGRLCWLRWEEAILRA